MNPRQRRLESDYQKLLQAFTGSDIVGITPMGGYPPEHYRVTLLLSGLVLNEKNQPEVVNEHVFDLILPSGYPKVKPIATPLSSIFHPNFDQGKICIADFWAPNQSLVDIICQIADLIQYRKFNVHSPLNAVAASWAQKAQADHEIPLSEIDIVMPDLSNEVKIN